MAEVALERPTKQTLSLGAKIARFVRRHGWSYAFVLPSMVTFTIFIFIPVVWAFLISFQDYDFVWSGKWVGFQNYVTAFTTQGGVFVQSIGHTLYYTFFTVVANILVALVLASLIQNRGKFTKTFFRAAYYLPAVTSAVIIAMIWRWIFNADWGFANYALSLIHTGPVRWLANPDIVMNSITLSTMLTVPATGVVLYSAAMGGIPTELYEAAELDGAGALQKWWHITVPLLKSTTLYLVVLYTIASFEVFEKIFIMVPSGVGNGAQVIVTQIYQNGFQEFRYGVAAAQAFVLFVMIASVAVVQFRLFRSDVEY